MDRGHLVSSGAFDILSLPMTERMALCVCARGWFCLSSGVTLQHRAWQDLHSNSCLHTIRSRVKTCLLLFYFQSLFCYACVNLIKHNFRTQAFHSLKKKKKHIWRNVGLPHLLTTESSNESSEQVR